MIVDLSGEMKVISIIADDIIAKFGDTAEMFRPLKQEAVAYAMIYDWYIDRDEFWDHLGDYLVEATLSLLSVYIEQAEETEDVIWCDGSLPITFKNMAEVNDFTHDYAMSVVSELQQYNLLSVTEYVDASPALRMRVSRILGRNVSFSDTVTIDIRNRCFKLLEGPMLGRGMTQSRLMYDDPFPDVFFPAIQAVAEEDVEHVPRIGHSLAKQLAQCCNKDLGSVFN